MTWNSGASPRIEAPSGSVTRYASSTQAYTDEGYRSLLAGAGFRDATFHPSLQGEPDRSQADFLVIVAEKA